MGKLPLYSLLISLGFLLVACGGDGSDGTNPFHMSPNPQPGGQGDVSGTVRNFYTFDAISDAKVTARAVIDGEEVELGAVDIDDNGNYALSDIPSDARVVVTADSSEYGEHSMILDFRGGFPVMQDILLIPAHATLEFDPVTEQSLDVNGAVLIDLPANSLVRADGSAPSGTVTAEITVIDPSSSPEIMPGDYRAENADTGAIAFIESFGALNVVLTDAEGSTLQLVDGAAATIRIPVASSVSEGAPESMPLFYFDEHSGYWVEEGSASLTAIGNQPYYVGEVAHFSTWNADRIMDTVNVSGCVADQNGNRVTGALAVTSGIDYISRTTALTNDEGQFTVPGRVNSQFLVSAQANTSSQFVTVNSTEDDVTLETCFVVQAAASTIHLSWGENPADLDSHLVGPLENGSQFNLSYWDREVTVGDTTLWLDVDDVTSFGPEIISLPAFPLEGTYHYYVHHYSGSSDIAASPARVEVTLRGSRRVFAPPSGTADECWHVFDIEVDSARQPTLVPVNEWLGSNVCGDRSFPGYQQAAQPNSLHKTAIGNKYYAD